MSGTYNLMRFIESDTPTEAFKRVSPLYMVPRLEGKHLEILRTRFGWGPAFAVLALGPAVGIFAMGRLRVSPFAVQIAGGRG